MCWIGNKESLLVNADNKQDILFDILCFPCSPNNEIRELTSTVLQHALSFFLHSLTFFFPTFTALFSSLAVLFPRLHLSLYKLPCEDSTLFDLINAITGSCNKHFCHISGEQFYNLLHCHGGTKPVGILAIIFSL